MHRRTLALLALFMTAATLTVAQAAPAGAAIVRSNISVSTFSLCGNVRLFVSLTGTSAEITPRLPIRVYASSPERGLPRTLVRTFSTVPATGEYTQQLLTAAPGGIGPGVQLDVEWTGGTDSFTSEPYVDQCPGTLFSVTPGRMLDTRTGQGTTGPGRVPVATTLSVDPRPVPGVPANGVTAIVMNLTVTEPAAAGFVTAWPCGSTRPTASNLNFAADQTIANLVVVDVTGRSATGSVCLYSSATTNLIADVTGYFLDDQEPRPIGGGIVSLDSPERALDTRTGAPPSSAGTVRKLQLGGKFDIPSTGVAAVAMNVTAADALVPGYITVFPCGTTPPNASNVNYPFGRATPNAAIVGLSASGELCIFTETDVDVIIDVTGYFSAAVQRNYQPIVPLRVADTRVGSALDTRPTARQKLEPMTIIPQKVLFASALTIVNVTATNVESEGWLAVFPCDRPVPRTSTLNVAAGQTVANSTLVRSNGSADICVYSTARFDLVVDLQGVTSGWPRQPAVS
jgi:hypothetical protein